MPWVSESKTIDLETLKSVDTVNNCRNFWSWTMCVLHYEIPMNLWETGKKMWCFEWKLSLEAHAFEYVFLVIGTFSGNYSDSLAGRSIPLEGDLWECITSFHFWFVLLLFVFNLRCNLSLSCSGYSSCPLLPYSFTMVYNSGKISQNKLSLP